jgi:hypothetical protein
MIMTGQARTALRENMRDSPSDELVIRQMLPHRVAEPIANIIIPKSSQDSIIYENVLRF